MTNGLGDPRTRDDEPLIAKFLRAEGSTIEWRGLTVHRGVVIPCTAATEVQVKILGSKGAARRWLYLWGEKCKIRYGDDVRTHALVHCPKPKMGKKAVYEFAIVGAKEGARIHLMNAWGPDTHPLSATGNSGMLVEDVAGDGRSHMVVRCNDGPSKPDFKDLVLEIRVTDVECSSAK